MIPKREVLARLDISQHTYTRHVDCNNLIEVCVNNELFVTKESFSKFKKDIRPLFAYEKKKHSTK